MDDRQAAPIDEDAEDASIHEIRKHSIEPFAVKIEELCLRHLSGFAAGDFPAEDDLEGLMREDKSCGIIRHEPSDDSGIASIPANQAVNSKPEKITWPGNRRTRGCDSINRFLPILGNLVDEVLDLVRTQP